MKPFTRKQHYLVLAILFIVTVLPRLSFRGPYLYDGDPVAYYEGAVSLLETGEYLIDNEVPFWPVGTSISMAPFIAVFNMLDLNPERAAFWHGLVFIYMAVAFTYLIGKWLFNPATGLIGAVLLAMAESPFLHSINSASDPGALAMLLGATYFMLLFLDTQSPKDLFLSFLLLGFSFLFRWNYALFLPLFFIFMVGDRRIWAFHLYPKFWILGFLGFIAGISIQLWFNTTHYGHPFKIGYSQLDYSEQFVFSVLIWLKNCVRVVYRVLFTWDFYSPLLAMFGTIGGLALWKAKRRDVLWLFLPWVVLGALSVVYFGVKPRLLIPIMPPMFLLGAFGMVRVYEIFRSSWPGPEYLKRFMVLGFSAMALVLFLPMMMRTLLHAHGHVQDKVTMQSAFAWVNQNSPVGSVIVTQPEYAGENDDWLRAGWRIWASSRYAGRETHSLRYPEYWANRKDSCIVVVNRFWFEAENLRYDDTEALAARFDSLRFAWNLEQIAEFEGKTEPMWLKKLNMLSFYPPDFVVFRPRFQIWRPAAE